jgi:hypothetical protein
VAKRSKESNKDTLLKLCKGVNAVFNGGMTGSELKTLMAGVRRLGREEALPLGFTDRVMESLGTQHRAALAWGALLGVTVAVLLAALVGTTTVWWQVEPQPPALTLFQGNDVAWWE